MSASARAAGLRPGEHDGGQTGRKTEPGSVNASELRGSLLVLSLLWLLAWAGRAAAQGDARLVAPAHDRAAVDENFVHFEALGNAGLYSLNYTRTLFDDWSARVGISYVALGASISRTSARADALTLPVMAHYLGVAVGAHRLELGLGSLLVHGSARARVEAREALRARFRVLGTATIGYRYLPRRGFTFNVSFTPVFGPLFVPWGGVGVGHTF